MEEQTAKKGKQRRCKTYCVAGGPNQISCTNSGDTPGITMHRFPSDPAVKLQWVRFVRRHRVDFNPCDYSNRIYLCSAHFESNCFSKRFSATLEEFDNGGTKRFLSRDAIPTVDVSTDRHGCSTSEISMKEKRLLKRAAFKDYTLQPTEREVFKETEIRCSDKDNEIDELMHPTTSDSRTVIEETLTASEGTDVLVSTSESAITQPKCSESTEVLPDIFEWTSVPVCPTTLEDTPRACHKCQQHIRDKKNLKRKLERLKKKMVKMTEERAANVEVQISVEEDKNEFPDDDLGKDDISDEGDVSDCDAEGDDDPEWSSQFNESESSGLESDDANDEAEKRSRNHIRFDDDGSTNRVYSEPKFLVFYSMLVSLFSMFCFKCKSCKPTVDFLKNGTMVTVIQNCLKCGDKAFIWRSQPLILTKYPAGNIALSFGILMAGASASKILLVFRHMGVCAMNIRTYFLHQRLFVLPAIAKHWENSRKILIEKVKGIPNAVWCGDGRFDSMGHSAKYGTYSMFCSTADKIVHFEVLQANESGGSNQMELEGAKRCFAYLTTAGVSVAKFISDRHAGITKWIRETQSGTKHFFDIWHVARSITKKMMKAGKEKGCEVILSWIKGVRNHIYWCATSTKEGFGEMILAKWKSFIYHVANRHEGHPNQLYEKCAHGQLETPRAWLKIGTPAFDKMFTMLGDKKLEAAIMKLSPDAQTSCLEGFHATLNHWHPKMLCFSWMGTFCRTALAALHFNENLRRECLKSKEGNTYTNVCYPKYKLGEEIVREIKKPPTYDYVKCIGKILFASDRKELEGIAKKYLLLTPKPLNTQFPDRLGKQEAMKKHKSRKSMEKAQLFPAEAEQDKFQKSLQRTNLSATTSTSGSKRKVPKCRQCGKPRKGHKKGSCD